MKTIISFLIILFLINCNEKKDNDNNNLLALFLLLQKPASESTSDLNTPVGRAVSVSGILSNISSSVTSTSNTSNFTMRDRKAKEMDKLQLLTIHTILSKGKESQEAKAALKTLLQKQTESIAQKDQKVNRRLTAWSSATTDSEGYTSYTFSGTVSGYAYTKVTQDIKAFTNAPTVTCNVTGYSSFTTSSTRKGTAKFTDGSFKTKTGSTKSSATVEFTGYGTLYGDLYKSIALFKKYNGNSAAFAASSSTKPSCETYQTFYNDFMSVYNEAELTGTLSYNTVSEFTSTISGSNFSVAGTFTSTSNSANGITISQNGQTANFNISNLVLKSIAAYSYNNSTLKYTGKYTITITGTVGGSAVNETLLVDFDT